MGTESERRFLVASEGWRNGQMKAERLRQAYVADTGKVTVRIRLSDDKRAQLAVKNSASTGPRAEFEYDIPLEDGRAMFALQPGQPVEKTRYRLKHEGFPWRVDVFDGPLSGLAIATVELDNPKQRFVRPEWAGREVSGDARYYTSSLSRRGLPG